MYNLQARNYRLYMNGNLTIFFLCVTAMTKIFEKLLTLFLKQTAIVTHAGLNCQSQQVQYVDKKFRQ